jgi:hypothetical protein
MASLTFRKLKWWGQKPASGATLGEPGTYAGAVTAETGDDGTVIDYRVEITGKIDESPSFNVEENESRLQRVLEVATNNLLAEKVGGLPAEQEASTPDPRCAPHRSLFPARTRRGPLRRSASFGTLR